jgi:predicted O-linked N-acetylglucosamine transferase (SPINDLY family)
MCGYTGDKALLLQGAKNFIHDRIAFPPARLWQGKPYGHEKIRIAYLSADYHKHATAYLVAGLMESHGRQRFEVLGVSFGVDDRSPMRARMVRSFDRFFDVRGMSDRDVARMLRDMEVDIAVDLKGYTTDQRPEIFSHRPAPVQVNYLGFPGSMGADFMDYVIADRIVAPFEDQPFYTEKLVHLPGSYQVNDSRREIAPVAPSRAEAGLPELRSGSVGNGFVFCCFNDSYKITAPVFDIWMRLLAQLPGSVLWLISCNPDTMAKLSLQAAARGIDPARLVFAPRRDLADHLARHRLADLFLDTLPYNAHTTASDALWAGLPVLTAKGESFAGRVAASLLTAVGLPELITENPADYEALALKLAQDSELLGVYRKRLAENRDSCALFDNDRFRRNIEVAYTTMWQRAEAGLPPESFSV